ncbi:MAG: prephenate dehydrogenase/arogenate dehydrogenase family protein [bacterium]
MNSKTLSLSSKFSSVAVIGLGLIGGSVASALRQQGCYVVAFDADPSNLQLGLELNVIDKGVSTINSVFENAELIIVAVPVLAMMEVFKAISTCFDTGVIITDVGSVKSPILEAVEKFHGRLPHNYVPGHPIAGSENHGVANADADLFKAHQVILTPDEGTSAAAVTRVTEMWQGFGASVSRMQASHHDLVLAQTSHLPHLLAYALVETLSSQGDSLEIFDYAAGGLRDFTRIAASDPRMWRDIFRSNRKPLLDILDRYMTELDELRDLIEQDESEEVLQRLYRAKAARDHFGRILEERSK